MKEDEIVMRLGNPALDDSGRRAIAAAGVKLLPDSARLWCLLGDFIQLGPATEEYELGDALDAYMQALRVEPSCVDALEGAAYYLDAIADNPKAAEGFARKALELGAGVGVHVLLSRILAELGRRDEAFRLLEDEARFVGQLEVRTALEELRDGLWDPT